MVILLSAVAIIAAAIMLVAWFVVGGGFGLIYLAMILAVVSMVLLYAARWIGSTAAPPHPVAPAPLAVDVPTRARVTHEPRRHVLTGDDETVDEDEVVDVTAAFPIKDYDHLWVTQILPLLQELDIDELAMVEARERGGRHRGGVLDAVESERSHRLEDKVSTDGAGPASEDEPVDLGWTKDDGEAWNASDEWVDRVQDWNAPSDTAEPAFADPAAVSGDPVDIEPVKVDLVDVHTDGVAESDDETAEVHEPIAAPNGAVRVRTFLGRPAGPIILRRD